jgi:hypothetical protein
VLVSALVSCVSDRFYIYTPADASVCYVAAVAFKACLHLSKDPNETLTPDPSSTFRTTHRTSGQYDKYLSVM